MKNRIVWHRKNNDLVSNIDNKDCKIVETITECKVTVDDHKNRPSEKTIIFATNGGRDKAINSAMRFAEQTARGIY